MNLSNITMVNGGEDYQTVLGFIKRLMVNIFGISIGDLYTGSFKNGLKHGEGSEYFGTQETYKGEYINGLPEGYGEYKWKDGSYYKGDFKQGLRNGYGVWGNNENST